MATIKKFEDLEVWQMARKFADSIYQLTLQGKFSKEYKFKDQIKESSGSVMDNIAEGFGRESRLEFINFLESQKAPFMSPNRSCMELLIISLFQKKLWNCTIRNLKLLQLKLLPL